MITLFVIIGLSLLIIGHEFGHFFAAKKFKLKVEEFGFGFPPKLFGKKKGETEYTVNALPFGGFVKIAGEDDQFDDQTSDIPAAEKARYFRYQPIWKRFVVTSAGVIVNFAIGWLLLSGVFMVGTPPVLVVSDVVKNSPAEEAGIVSGDILKGYTDADSFIEFVNAHKGETVPLAVMRGGKDLTISAPLRKETKENEGALGVFLVEGGIERTNPLRALWQGFLSSFEIMWGSILAFVALVKNLALHAKVLEGVVGPIGIVGIAQGAGKLGLVYLVQLLALISLNLSILNLMPFPALDGGRLLFLVAEKAIGKPLSRRAERIVNTAGFILLIILMVVVSVRDIGRLF